MFNFFILLCVGVLFAEGARNPLGDSTTNDAIFVTDAPIYRATHPPTLLEDYVPFPVPPKSRGVRSASVPPPPVPPVLHTATGPISHGTHAAVPVQQVYRIARSLAAPVAQPGISRGSYVAAPTVHLTITAPARRVARTVV